MKILRSVPDLSKTFPIRRVIGPAGDLIYPFDPQEVRATMEALVSAEQLLARLSSLADQGDAGGGETPVSDLPFVVASARALAAEDWAAPDARAAIVFAFARGAALQTILHHVFANAKDPTRGHPAPGAFADSERRCLAPGAAPAAHLPQAAGVAWAMRLRRHPSAVLALFGAEAASEPDFHNALGFAAVYRAPVIFVGRVSLRRSAPDAAGTLAQKAAAYGIPAERVDGQDPLALLLASREALARARSGQGPALLEVLDDGATPTSGHERLRLCARSVSGWTDEDERALTRAMDAELAAAEHAARATPGPTLDALFEDVFVRNGSRVVS